jgi:fatty-acyl-CoA synthase
MEEMGFAQVTADAETGRIEGVAETFWFGFKDDMVVRIADGAIDFRSVSRVGVSDLGANAARIAALRDAVAERLNR